MEEGSVVFWRHSQDDAIVKFPALLAPHLPCSNSIYNRIIAPHNDRSRYCLFAATFPPPLWDDEVPNPKVPKIYTILFADRSRYTESQIWIFNPLIELPTPLATRDAQVLAKHLDAAVQFLQNVPIPEAPGWPFQPRLRLACLHETITSVLLGIPGYRDSMRYKSEWAEWILPTAGLSAVKEKLPPLPPGFSTRRVPEDQLDAIISTSSVRREASTLMIQPNLCICDAEGVLCAWSFIGVDGSLATLYVLPEHRGKGFAKYVATSLLASYAAGDFKDIGSAGQTGFVHADVMVGNVGSESVMRSLGGKVMWNVAYLHLEF